MSPSCNKNSQPDSVQADKNLVDLKKRERKKWRENKSGESETE